MMKSVKSLFSLLLCTAMLCAALPVSAAPDTTGPLDAAVWGDVNQDNFFRISSSDAWNQGELENLTVANEVGDGALRLAEGQTEGTYISPEMEVPAFEYLVASWGADLPQGTWVEISARVYVDMKSAWSGWMSWGKYGPSIKRGSANTKDDLAYVDTDILTIRGSDGETASKVQLQATLHSDDPAATPTLRQICGTLKNTLEGQEIPVYHPVQEELPEKVLLDTPCYSQMIRDSAIGSVICSPTSMTMLLNDRDPSLDLFPEEIALWEFDFNYDGFGNWPFTVGAAGLFGYSAYVQYADLDFLRQELAQGRSVAISVRYSSSTSGSNPYLENGAANDTSGHLIVIVGYETVDGVDYFYSNDSAASGDASCALRRYRADQLDICWGSHVAYAVSERPEANAGQDAPQRIPAELELVENDGYRLLADGEEVVLSKGFATKTRNLGAGTALFVTDKSASAQLPDGMKSTSANLEMTYTNVTGAGYLYLNSSKLQQLEATAATVYVILNNGVTYTAALEVPRRSLQHRTRRKRPNQLPSRRLRRRQTRQSCRSPALPAQLSGFVWLSPLPPP